jgi:hypothetical protein
LLKVLNVPFYFDSEGQVANGVLIDCADTGGELDGVITEMLCFEVYVPQSGGYDFLQVGTFDELLLEF